MYTRCPQCRTVYRIDTAQLRRGRGEAICQRCGIIFGALENLGRHIKEALADHTTCLLELPKLGDAEAVAPEPVDSRRPESGTRSTVNRPESLATSETMTAEPSPPILDDTEERSSSRTWTIWGWRLGTVLLAMLLIGQIVLFEGERLAQNAHLRPVLEEACQWLGCHLPPFRNLADIKVVDRALYPVKVNADGYEFYLVIVNQSPYPQAYPLLKLTLTALDGTPIAHRVFKPEEYLGTSNPPLIPSYRMIFVHLNLAAPKRQVGGFQFELLA